jgi:flagellar L-ring protein precursor FlgH
MRTLWHSVLLLTLAVPPLLAQGADSAATAPAPVTFLRASWLADRRGFAVGEILTVLIEEQATASERVDRSAGSTRSQRGSLNLPTGTSAAFGTGLDESSRQAGANSRVGLLTGTISVRVTEIGPDGALLVTGSREVVVDGRRQQLTVTGAVRPEDVSPQNVVASTRLADARISFKGANASPRRGIIGKILGMLWP